jgi:hypothetical protein
MISSARLAFSGLKEKGIFEKHQVRRRIGQFVFQTTLELLYVVSRCCRRRISFEKLDTNDWLT